MKWIYLVDLNRCDTIKVKLIFGVDLLFFILLLTEKKGEQKKNKQTKADSLKQTSILWCRCRALKKMLGSTLYKTKKRPKKIRVWWRKKKKYINKTLTYNEKSAEIAFDKYIEIETNSDFYIILFFLFIFCVHAQLYGMCKTKYTWRKKIAEKTKRKRIKVIKKTIFESRMRKSHQKV